MTIEDFKEYVKTQKVLNTAEVRCIMEEMGNETRRITFRLNSAYHTLDEVRDLLSELFGYRVPQGDNAVVGAGAVVTKDVAANTVVGGVPAKFIKTIL